MDPTPEAPLRARQGTDRTKRLIVLSGLGALVVAAVLGFVLTRPSSWKRSGPPITVSGWAPYWQPEAALASFSDNTAAFSDVSMFAYHAIAADAVSPYDGVDPNTQTSFAQHATPAGVALTASIIDDTAPGAMAAILADPAQRAVHVQTIVDFANKNRFDGIDLDYEKFAFSDGRATWASTSPNWIAFLGELAAGLHSAGKTLAVSVPPVYDGGQTADSGFWVYDYAAMGEIVDHIRIMAYDYSTSEPGPIAPIDWVTKAVTAAKQLVPPAKLVLGVPVYGYDWPQEITGTCPVGQDPKRRNLSTKSAAELAASKGIVPTWSAGDAERTFRYQEQLLGNDSAGNATTCVVNHVVWYADADAVHARAWLAEREDLSGIALWSLGSDDAHVWDAIDAARDNVATWPPIVPAASATASTTAA